MTFKEIRERLANRDAIRERQDIEEREEAERDREQERLKLRKLEKEKKEQQAAAERQALIEKDTDEQPLASKEQGSLASDKDSKDQATSEEQSIDEGTENVIVSSADQSSKTTRAAADTSSEVAKKVKEKFMKEVSRVIVKVLDPFRKADATRGKIQNTEDFKHLAKKV